MHITILSTIFSVGITCGPETLHNLTMEEIVMSAEIVVFGMETKHMTSKTDDYYEDADFQVFCVFKNSDESLPIPENITIEHVYPRSSCSVTKVEIGEPIILALERIPTGNFQWIVPVFPNSASFEATDRNFERLSNIPGLNNPKRLAIPDGAQSSRCLSVSSSTGVIDTHPVISAVTFIQISLYHFMN